MGDHALHTVAADAVILAPDDHGTLHVLVIQRRWEPFAGRWALPGGHVDAGEPTEDAARRELKEETGVTAPTELRQVGVFDARGRDPRGHVITVAYTETLPELVPPTPDDDAVDARWMPVADALADKTLLAFDHHDILVAAVAVQYAN